MNEKTYFCFLLEWADTFNLLSAEQCGILIKAMIAFEKTGEEPSFDDELVEFAWKSNIRSKMLALKEHYQDKSKKASDAGKASAEKRRKNKQNSTDLTEVENAEQNSTELTDVENAEHSPTDSTNIDLDLDLDLVKKEKQEKEKDVIAKVMETWNELPLANISAIRGKRLESLKARLKEYSLDEILTAIQGIRDCPFLLGQKGNWLIDFDWFIRPNNFPKVLEGKYKERENGTHSGDVGEVPPKEYGTVL